MAITFTSYIDNLFSCVYIYNFFSCVYIDNSGFDNSDYYFHQINIICYCHVVYHRILFCLSHDLKCLMILVTNLPNDYLLGVTVSSKEAASSFLLKIPIIIYKQTHTKTFKPSCSKLRDPRGAENSVNLKNSTLSFKRL